jgi:hypothetical protein
MSGIFGLAGVGLLVVGTLIAMAPSAVAHECYDFDDDGPYCGPCGPEQAGTHYTWIDAPDLAGDKWVPRCNHFDPSNQGLSPGGAPLGEDPPGGLAVAALIGLLVSIVGIGTRPFGIPRMAP